MTGRVLVGMSIREVNAARELELAREQMPVEHTEVVRIEVEIANAPITLFDVHVAAGLSKAPLDLAAIDRCAAIEWTGDRPTLILVDGRRLEVVSGD